MATGDAGSRRWLTPRLHPCTLSSAITSSQAPPSSRTAGKATLDWTDTATPMKRAVSARPGVAAMSRLRSCCPPFTELPGWPRGGFSVHTKVPSTTRTCTTTSASSCSALIGVTPAAGEWCSTEYSSLPFGTLPYATQTSPQASGLAIRHRHHPPPEASRQASSEQRLVDPCGPVKWRALEFPMLRQRVLRNGVVVGAAGDRAHRVGHQRLGAQAIGDAGEIELAAVDNVGALAARGSSADRCARSRCPPAGTTAGRQVKSEWLGSRRADEGAAARKTDQPRARDAQCRGSSEARPEHHVATRRVGWRRHDQRRGQCVSAPHGSERTNSHETESRHARGAHIEANAGQRFSRPRSHQGAARSPCRGSAGSPRW